MKTRTIRVLMAACVFALSSCVIYQRKGADEFFAAVGTDADKVKVNNGLTITKMNNSKAFAKAADTVKKMFDAYLIAEGLKFATGAYYNQEGKVVDAATTVKLEELRNAKSVADAEHALEVLKFTHVPGA